MKEWTEALASEELGDEPETPKRSGLVRRMYDWTIHWAETPYALWALLALAFAEASFFPIPPDVLLIAMALGAPRKSLRYAAVCTTGSVLGALLGYAIGRFFFEAVGRTLIDFYGAWDAYEGLSEGFRAHGFVYVFGAALTPIPYKVFTIAAGACGVELGVVIAASVLGRGLRFFAVGALFRFFGQPIKRFIDRYFNLLTVLFLVLLVGGFFLVRILWGQNEAGPAPSEHEPATEEPLGAEPEEGQGEQNEGAQEELEGGMLSQQARRRLLELARGAVEAAVKGQRLEPVEVDAPELQGHQGAFVTLKTRGRLRGCIGRFVADRPLWKTVRRMAASSATEDSRFETMRLRPEELGELDIEISVLSPLERIENPLDLELGTHGIYIRRGMRTGCFLPQVATETGWSKEQFLSQCCAGKAGLPPDAWQDPETEVLVFTAEIVTEGELGN